MICNELGTRGYLVDVGLVEVWEWDADAREGLSGGLPLRNIGDSFKKILIVNDDIMLRRNNAGVETVEYQAFPVG